MPIRAPLVLLVLALTLPTPASATESFDLNNSDLVRRLDDLEATVNQQREELSVFKNASFTNGSSSNCDDCATACYDTSCGSCGFYASAEVTFLKPYVSGNIFFGNTAIGMNSDYEAGTRFVLGYEDGEGLGTRVRYWLYDHNFFDPTGTLPGAGFGTTLGIDMDVVDLEATFRKEFCSWELLVLGGFRYGRLEFSSAAVQTYFEGSGLTFGTEVARPIGNRGFSLLGKFRGSMLYGDIRDNGFLLGGPVAIADEIARVWEIQLGLEYAREFCLGEVALQLSWEAQSWENNAFAFFGPSELGFSGFTFGAELRR